MLGEDNGAYVFSLPAATQREFRRPSQFRVGATTAIDGKPFSVASNEQVALISAQGELPKLPPLGQPFAMVELRSADGEVLSIDYGGAAPARSRAAARCCWTSCSSRACAKRAPRKKAARQFACPHCGAQVEVALASSKSITCRSCNSLIDLTQGMGGELRHAHAGRAGPAADSAGHAPASCRACNGRWWAIQHRMGHEPGDPDEHFGWDEYLLYNRKRGFIFLVDSAGRLERRQAHHRRARRCRPASRPRPTWARSYQLKYSYDAQTTYVAGEFYWPVERGQKTFNRDFAKGTSLLSMEETPARGDLVQRQQDRQRRRGQGLQAGGQEGPAQAQRRRAHQRRRAASAAARIILMFLVILILLVLIKACMDDDGGRLGSSRRQPQQRRLVRRVFQWRRPQVAVCIDNDHFSGEHHGH